jgi:festuclavine dehydrogenase
LHQDWNDASTYETPFQYKFPNGENLTAVYLIGPEGHNPSEPMITFVDIAIKHGVKRFVMLTGSEAAKGGFHSGGIWQHLDDTGVEYCVLRTTWFMGSSLITSMHCGASS